MTVWIIAPILKQNAESRSVVGIVQWSTQIGVGAKAGAVVSILERIKGVIYTQAVKAKAIKQKSSR